MIENKTDKQDPNYVLSNLENKEKIVKRAIVICSTSGDILDEIIYSSVDSINLYYVRRECRKIITKLIRNDTYKKDYQWQGLDADDNFIGGENVLGFQLVMRWENLIDQDKETK